MGSKKFNLVQENVGEICFSLGLGYKKKSIRVNIVELILYTTGTH